MSKHLRWVDGQFHIHALVDPRDNMIRYVGISDDVKFRYHEHLSHQAERADSVTAVVVDVALL
jgi:predicted GIY-YIG superfamily endonuclease